MPVFKTGAINPSANSPTILFYYRLRMVAEFCSVLHVGTGDAGVRGAPAPHDHFVPLGYTNILLASPVLRRAMACEKSFIAMRSVMTG
jgi:hypothetical protein